MAVIEAADLVKEFSRPAVLPGRLPRLRGLFSTKRDITRAVSGVNFQVEPGELVGYLGPNGAGKSTTIKMLTGILTPTSGVCRVAGLEPSRDRARNARNIGVVFGQRTQLWYDLPLRDSFEVLGDLYNLDRTTYRDRVGLFTELLDLSDFLDTPVRSLSLGQRMRGDLVAAMLHAPSILFLDEPTVGLDVVAKARLTEFIAETNRTSGTTVVLTTHDMEDVERLCQRIIVIDSGTVLYDGDLAKLKERFMPYRFLVLTLAERSVPQLVEIPFATEVDAAEAGAMVAYPDRTVVLRFDPREIATPALIAQASQVYQVDELSIVDPRLTDVIAQLYDGVLT
ncbi:ATP-binding cassette domain-containing protein [Kribbella hippodromi]|uniref:ATP-binding cassette domain-containing protein n=1 Tax=Kribbella hippodromi TaxID=434347 RepID=A0ABP4NY14_9ACTN